MPPEDDGPPPEQLPVEHHDATNQRSETTQVHHHRDDEHEKSNKIALHNADMTFQTAETKYTSEFGCSRSSLVAEAESELLSRSNATTAKSCTTLDDNAAATLSSSMTVMGIYTRATVPRECELPEDYGLSHVTKDQVMCRRKLNTRPTATITATPQDSHQDNDISDSDGDGIVEKAMFVPEQGLVGQMFFHTDLEDHDESSSDEEDDDDHGEKVEVGERVYEERAILFQAVEHYEQLMEEPKLSKCFRAKHDAFGKKNGNNHKSSSQKDGKATSVSHLAKKDILEDILEDPRFGEQIIVQGMDAQHICIGDIFEIEGGLSPLKVEITCPRLCCSWVDKRNGSRFGLKGLKRFCNAYGLGGFFARVLIAGELTDGMNLVRTAHPYPKWTLSFTAYALYGEGPKTYLMAGWAHWQRSKEELKELSEIKQLGLYEWQEEALYILNNWEKYRPEDKQRASKQIKAAKATRMGRLRLAVTESKALGNLSRFCTSAAKAVGFLVLPPSAGNDRQRQHLLQHVLVAFVACMLLTFLLAASRVEPCIA